MAFSASDFGDYNEAKVYVPSGRITNGDYIFKIIEYKSSAVDKAGESYVSLKTQAYQDMDGNPVSGTFNSIFYVKPRKSEIDNLSKSQDRSLQAEVRDGAGKLHEKQKKTRHMQLSQLKSITYSLKGRQLSAEEFVAVLNDPRELVDELIGARVIWTRRYNEPSKAELTFERYFPAKPDEQGKYRTIYGSLLMPYSEGTLSDYNKRRLWYPDGATGSSSSIADRAASQLDDFETRKPLARFEDDEIPF